ncbi:hypothetical protein COI_0188 [Mannheimia haemolytica serotype A2 str. OVINE]|nr:hypothetical protein B824_25275 [Mannheimia haemolytica USDA-ARS-USMARC-184]EEY11163.1 hypothetical protein COI_0188 [Mannheimia haemolytica serotype A2 str. OVINE]EEY11547.1 hypothetical protein COK_2381 [Mannheimia haemolytica serotype A2 str. BOVINE]TRC23472.1 hypothetical protein FEA24_00370 [Mannheimia haemolytica]TRC26098.1 hypothetical protein FEA55_00315 [Mannheimia haemolytica]
MFLANFTINLPSLFTTPILSSDKSSKSVSPPEICKVSFSFLLITLPSSPTNLKPSFSVATSSVVPSGFS